MSARGGRLMGSPGEVAAYRRLAGGLLLWGILPLPFLYIVQRPFWLAAAAAGGWLLLRPFQAPRLPTWAQNLLGVLILAVVIAAGGARVGPLRPLGHLLLLLVSARALMVVDRRSFLRLLPGLFLVWVVALTSSTHVTVLLYFAGSAAVWWWVGMEVNLLGVVSRAPDAALPLVRPRHALLASVVALLLALPVFVAVPRLRSPWVAGRGGAQSVTGFSSRVQLSGVGTIRRSQEIALTVRETSGRRLDPSWSRLRATALERVTADSWAPRRADELPLRDGSLIWVHGRRPLDGTAELEITVRRPQGFLFLPPAAVAVESPVPVRRDPAGGLILAGEVAGPLTYRVWVARGGPIPFVDPPEEVGRRLQRDPDVASLARRIVGRRRGAAERAAAVEAYLQENYRYSLTGLARIGPDPVAWFLLEARQGHCEYFAGGMVALLECLDIPARMAAGYSGGELGAAGDELLVRQASAHTWVEAWLGPDRGWESFDPTPAVGVPGVGAGRRGMGLQGLWDWVQASWDRYVLTYGLGEQLRLLEGIGDALVRLLAHVDLRVALAVGIGALLLLGLGRARRVWAAHGGARRRPPAAGAMERLRRSLLKHGEEVPVSATMRWVAGRAARRWPGVADDIAALAERADLELYSTDGWGRLDRRAVRRRWGRIRAAQRGRAAPEVSTGAP